MSTPASRHPAGGIPAPSERVVSTVMPEEPSPPRPASPRTDGEAAGESAGALGPLGEVFLDVPLEISVELGRLHLPLGEVLRRLAPGHVLTLDKAAGAALEVRVQSRLVARGEAIAVDGRLGVRIVELVDGDLR